MGEVSKVSFSIEGDFITKLAREKYYEDNDLKYAINILMSATETDEISYNEKVGTCIQILDGKAQIVGVYPGDDYGLVETPDNPSLGFLEHAGNINKKLKENARRLEDEHTKICFLIDYLMEKDIITDYILRNIDSKYCEEYGEHMFDMDGTEPEQSDIVDEPKELSYNPDEDYGWLEPNGTYHPVPWGEHGRWASNWADEHYPFMENTEIYRKKNAEGKLRFHFGRDFLIYNLHWVLVDNPSQGAPRIVCDEVRRMTKAQKEFLYKHFKDRGMDEEANRLYEEDKYGE